MMSPDVLQAFLAEQDLPDQFRLTFDNVCVPMAARATALHRAKQRTIVLGLCGAQGSGKSTIAAAAVALLRSEGLNAVCLSLDDVYLGREARAWLAGKVHPLLAVRGPPGTHDVALACSILDSLALPQATPLPSFDKAFDERKPKSAWATAQGPVDVVIFEGWCVGAKAQTEAQLADPINALERTQDPSGAWRTYGNRQLREPYQALFARLDNLVLLAAPGFEVVQAWRAEQERKLRDRTGHGMTETEVARFILHYERLTRWILQEMPDRADWTIPLDSTRNPQI